MFVVGFVLFFHTLYLFCLKSSCLGTVFLVKLDSDSGVSGHKIIRRNH